MFQPDLATSLASDLHDKKQQQSKPKGKLVVESQSLFVEVEDNGEQLHDLISSGLKPGAQAVIHLKQTSKIISQGARRGGVEWEEQQGNEVMRGYPITLTPR